MIPRLFSVCAALTLIGACSGTGGQNLLGPGNPDERADGSPNDGESDGGGGATDGAPGKDGGAADVETPPPPLATRFDSETAWAVPKSGAIDEGFYNSSGFADNWSWSTFDINGDGKPDFVWTADPSESSPHSIWGGTSNPHWKVFLNDGSGFAATPVEWKMPGAGVIEEGFFNSSGWATDWSWSTFDIDGDKKPDFVWTADPSKSSPNSIWGGTSNPHWKVFLNTGSGFAATAVEWKMPSGGAVTSGFFNTSGFADDWSWSTFDINGDGKPDFVWTADPSKASPRSIWGGAANPHWKVFLNTGSGFAATPVEWKMPSGGAVTSGFFNASGFADDWSWSTFDIDGDKKPDFVWTADPSKASPKSIWGGAANPHWKVFLNTGSGFAATPVEWKMPSGGAVTSGFSNSSGSADDWSWSTLDMNGDKKPDFVWTADPSKSSPKSIWGGTTNPHWKVFLNTGSGFALTPTEWKMPDAGEIEPGFFNSSGFADDWSWSTFDIDGDARPDFVWTADPSKSSPKSIWGGASTPHWKVFRGVP